jgi:ABC-type nitrate/sulfonate/bicarbonate transport system ATPase subunit
MTHAVEVAGVSKVYGPAGAHTFALDRISFDVDKGEFVCLVGASGCGKTTLLRLIAGLDQASAGRILVAGEPTRGTHPSISAAFQEPRLLPWLDVAANIAFGGQRLTPAERRTRVAGLLKRIGLDGYGAYLPKNLSGGQQQRVSIARALIGHPGILLLDEPFSALDYQTKLLLERDVHRIIRDGGKTALLVTHDIEEAISMSDRVIVLSGRPAQVKNEYEVALTVASERTPLNSRDAPEFRGYCKSIWEDLNIERAGL